MDVLTIVLAVANGALLVIALIAYFNMRRVTKSCSDAMIMTSEAYETLKTTMQYNDLQILNVVQEVSKKMALNSVLGNLKLNEENALDPDAPNDPDELANPSVPTEREVEGANELPKSKSDGIDDVVLLKDILPKVPKCSKCKRKDKQ